MQTQLRRSVEIPISESIALQQAMLPLVLALQVLYHLSFMLVLQFNLICASLN